MLHVGHQMHGLVLTVVQSGMTPGVTVAWEGRTHLEWLHPVEGGGREKEGRRREGREEN